MLPVLLDLLRTNNDLELRSLTGLLRNLSRHARDKNDFCKFPFFLIPRSVLNRKLISVIRLVVRCVSDRILLYQIQKSGVLQLM